MSAAVTVYRPGADPERDVPLERVADHCAEPDALVWIDVEHPTPDELERLGAQLGLPEFAIEDAVQAHQRPKLDRYPEVVMTVAYGVRIDGGNLTLHEIDMFVARGYLVTVRHHPPFRLEDAPRRVAERERPDAAFAAYAVLDEVVDGYQPAVDMLSDAIEELEDRVVLHAAVEQRIVAEAISLKRDVLLLGKVLNPLRDVLLGLAREDAPVAYTELSDELQDLTDHAVRAAEELALERDVLEGVMQAYLAAVSNRLNELVLRITCWAAIVVVPTLIASVYGMNFDHMPELHWRLGYAWSLGLMLATATALWIGFRRRGYL